MTTVAKGKVERFNHYLRYSFYHPLVSRLKQAGLVLDTATANVEVRHWLGTVANRRVHGTTGRVPAEALLEERPALQDLPRAYTGQVLGAAPGAPVSAPSAAAPASTRQAVRLQHPLALYEALLREERT